MKNVSSEFIKTMNTRRDFYYTATIDFVNGEKIVLGKDDLASEQNGIVQSAESSAFPLGFAISKRLTLSIKNNYSQYANYDFFNAKVNVKLHYDLSENTETLNLGEYTVREPEEYGTTITLSALDNFYKTDTDYAPSGFPKTMFEALQECCSHYGLTLFDSAVQNGDYIIQKSPTDITGRQFIGMCAMIAGGNAVCDEYGRVKILTYDLSVFENNKSYWGGIFDNDTPYSTGDNVNGGLFDPWDVGMISPAADFTSMQKYHVLHKGMSPMITTDDVVITGIRITDDNNIYEYGTEGYVLSVSNQLLAGNEQDAVERIGKLIVGLRFRPFTMDHINYPLCDFSDLCYISDRRYRYYQSIITDIDYSFRGFTVLKCSADSPQRNSSKYISNPEIEAVIKARRETEKQITEYDKAVQTLTNMITQSFGVFKTEEVLEDGSVIYYMHDEPLLEDSEVIWKMTADAFAVSTDGGLNWNSGIDADGNAVVNVLSAVGINANWINAGTLSANRIKGGTLTLGRTNNQNGILELYDSTNVLVSYMDNTGFKVYKGKISGPSVELGGNDGKYGNLKVYNDYDNVAIELDRGNMNMYASNGAGGINLYKNTNSSEREIYIDADGVHAGVLSLIKDPLDYSSYKGGGINGVSSYLSMSLANSVVPIESTYGYLLQNGMDIYNGNGTRISAPNIFCGQTRYIGYNWNDTIMTIEGALIVLGTKSRAAKTNNYNTRLAYCYEMASPIFGDIGSGTLDENGECYIEIDDAFTEMTRTDTEYHVFLQKQGSGDIWVEEKEQYYFKVKGTPNLSFEWEIKALQNGFENLRLEDLSLEEEEENSDMNLINSYSEDDYQDADLELMYYAEIENYEKEMEEIYYD